MSSGWDTEHGIVSESSIESRQLLHHEYEQDASFVGEKERAHENVSSGARDATLRHDRDVREDQMEGGLLAVGVCLWYLFSVVSQIMLKKSLLVLESMPLFVTLAMLVTGLPYNLVLWVSGARSVPKVPLLILLEIMPMALAHAAGTIGLVFSMASVSVAFTHIVKSLEPVFNALFGLVLADVNFSWPVYLAIVPVVMGVSICSISDASYSHFGLVSAMVSNVGYSYRNVRSKIFLHREDVSALSLDAVNLFAVIQALSACCVLPLVLLFEMPQSLEQGFWTRLLETNSSRFALRDLALAGICFHLYYEAAFKVLKYLHPLSHSIINTLKRVFVIGASIVVFHTSMNPLNGLGCVVALLGAGLYQYAVYRTSKS
ncbi:Triose phosphate/phosphate translocator TPT, chloroplastic [Porphyridium purpureum]|uniref:Triose phosphate/phosphate translocator TPT, chloroplastic n=1 Tax=Porphyridium purpureum TaxID=35688 RepID=A0A5J4YVR3_PORPP|nr:Triose phosphate/phosphate translocator TPT, chloroplastic [Porphyridium purpureum]|eukprot:POR3655..scf227_4